MVLICREGNPLLSLEDDRETIDNARTRKLLSDTEEQLAEVRPEEAFAMFFSEMNGREMTPEERELMRQVIAQEMGGDE